MFDGKRFFPETGTPIRKMARIRTLFAVCDPEPFAVATWREKSLTTGSSPTLASELVWVSTLDMPVVPLPAADVG